MAGVITSCLPVICITLSPIDCDRRRSYNLARTGLYEALSLEQENSLRGKEELCTGTTDSKETFALVCRGNILFSPVFGHGPSSNEDLLISQPCSDLFVFQRPLMIFIGDHFANHFSNSYRRQHIHRLISPLKPCVKEELQLEHTLRTMHIFIGRDTADGGFVHANILSYLFQHERFQTLNSVLEELLLKLDDARHHLDDRLIPLLDTANDPLSGTQFLIEVGLGLDGAFPIRSHELFIVGTDPHAWQTVIVKQDNPLPFLLHHEHIRHNGIVLSVGKWSCRLGLE